MSNVEAQAQPFPLGEAAAVSFAFRVNGIALLLAAGLVARLFFATYQGFDVDIGTFTAWSNQLTVDDPWNFYKENFFTDYAPGYMYVLWFLGELNAKLHLDGEQFQYALKIPSIIADLASAYLLYRMLDGQKPQVRLGVAAIYIFFPAALFIGALWGQVDSLLAFFLLLSVYFISRGKPVHGALAYTVGFLIKPQAIAALPFLAFWILRDNPPWRSEADRKTVALCTVAPLLLLLVLITPFFELEPWRLVTVLYEATDVETYRVNSFWAYNFWNLGGLFDWGFKCDVDDIARCGGDEPGTTFLGIATRYWGLAMFLSSLGVIIYALRNTRGTGFLALGTALSILAFYMFLTRMHERYVFAAFLPLLLACVLLHSRALWAAFIGLGTLHFINLYHVFNYYYPRAGAGSQRPELPSIRWEWLYDWFEDARGPFLGINWDPLGPGGLEWIQVASFLMLLGFVVLVASAFVLGSQPPAGQAGASPADGLPAGQAGASEAT